MARRSRKLRIDIQAWEDENGPVRRFVYLNPFPAGSGTRSVPASVRFDRGVQQFLSPAPDSVAAFEEGAR